MRMALCIFDDTGNNIIARSDDLYCEIDSDMELAMNEHHQIDLFNEVGQLMVHELKKQLTAPIILNLLRRAKENENGN